MLRPTALLAEMLGTFWLVLGGCGSAVLAAKFSTVGIGLVGVSMAFGLSLLTMAYAVGPISGCHLNPAVTIGLTVARRFPVRDVLPYIVAQLVGAVLAAAALAYIASGAPNFDLAVNGLAANGYAQHSPGQYGAGAALLTELIMTFMFLIVILASTDKVAPVGFAPIAIGLCLTLIHLISIPITNTSVNPARSTGPAFIVGGWALQQLWLFWLAPILGATLAGIAYPALAGKVAPQAPVVGEKSMVA